MIPAWNVILPGNTAGEFTFYSDQLFLRLEGEHTEEGWCITVTGRIPSLVTWGLNRHQTNIHDWRTVKMKHLMMAFNQLSEFNRPNFDIRTVLQSL